VVSVMVGGLFRYRGSGGGSTVVRPGMAWDGHKEEAKCLAHHLGLAGARVATRSACVTCEAHTNGTRAV